MFKTFFIGFTEADRVENIRRIGEVARLMVDAGLIVLVSFISPFRSERLMARELFADGEFLEVFVDTSLEECERRDPNPSLTPSVPFSSISATIKVKTSIISAIGLRNM